MSSRSRSPTWCRCCTAARRPGTRRTSTPSPRSSTPTRPETSTTTARILGSIAQQVHDSGRAAVVEGWLDLFDVDERLDRHPGRRNSGQQHPRRARSCRRGRPLAARRGAGRGFAASRRGCCSAPNRSHAGRALHRRPRADAGGRRAPRSRSWRPTTPGARRRCSSAAPLTCCSGTRTVRTRPLRKPSSAPRRSGSTETRAIALGERSMLAAAREDVRTADALAEEAQRVVEEGALADYPTSALALAASARSRLRHGQWDHARRLLTAATRQTPHLTYALPWLAVQARIELADAYVTLRDREAAEHMLEEARGILAVRPDLGVLGEAVARLELELAAMPEARTGGSSGLTRAELRLLPHPLHAPVLPGDRRAPPRLEEHDQDPGDLRLPEARRLQPERGGRRRRGPRPRRGRGAEGRPAGGRRGGRVACPLARPPRRGSAKRRFHPFGMKPSPPTAARLLARR